MGAWDPAIFSDDVAGDVRDGYRQRVADGADGVAATDELIRDWLGQLDDDDPDAYVFWLALAATQSKVGRLEDRVRDRAIEIIDSGVDLDRWRTDGLKRQRQKHLLKLRDQLTGPQPAPKRIRVQRLYVPPFEAGDVMAFELSDGDYILLVIEGADDAYCNISPLDSKGPIPDLDKIPTLRRKRPVGCVEPEVIGLYTTRASAIPYNRLTKLDVAPLEPQRRDGGIVWNWQHLKSRLLDDYDWDNPDESFWPETLPPMTQSEVDAIAEAFLRFCGRERFDRFSKSLVSVRNRENLRYWQEQLWSEFSKSFDGDLPKTPIAIEAILKKAHG